MPPTPARLHELLLACGFTVAQLESITQASMGVGLDAITTATDPAERALAVVRFAERYALILPLTATILTAGADRPALQNVLLDDNMALEDGRVTQSVAMDLIKLEGRVERMFDKLDAKLDAAIAEMHNMRADSARQPIVINGKTATFFMIVVVALIIAQVGLLAFVGTLPHG